MNDSRTMLLNRLRYYNRRLEWAVWQVPRILKYSLLSDCARVQGRARAEQPILLKGRGRIRFGEKVCFGVDNSPLFFSAYAYLEARETDSSIEIGSRVWINNGCILISAGPGISLGNDVLLGSEVQIYDSDFHDLHPQRRRSGIPQAGAVTIADNVFIGSRVTILKGVNVGRNAIIGAGSIVTKCVPEGAIVAGNPARVVGQCC